MRKTKAIAWLTAVSMLAMCPAEGLTAKAAQRADLKQEFYVSVDGSDQQAGTKDAPFATIQRAQEAVRTVNKDMSGDITVHVGEGVYVQAEALAFTQEDSASNGHRIIYEGAGDGKTMISGGTQITGWTLHDAEKGIYKASVPAGMEFRQLYVNGEKAIRARSGKSGTYSNRILGAERLKGDTVLAEIETDPGNPTAKEQADGGRIYLRPSDGTIDPSWKNLNDIELHVMTAWTPNILRVKTIEQDGDRYVVKFQEPESYRVFNRPHPNIDCYVNVHEFIYYAENAYELIDEENEWYLDRETDTVYYKAPAGIDMGKQEFTAPVLDTVLSIGGTVEQNVMGLTFQGFTFAYTNWLVPSLEGFVDGQGMQYVKNVVFADNNVGVARPDAGIEVVNARDIVLQGNVVENMGATGIDLHYGASGCKVYNNKVRNISGNGISVGKFAKDEQTDYHEPYNPQNEQEICDNDWIVNNEITHIGTDYEGGMPIAAGYPRNILIAYNTIAYAPYSGISVGYGWTSGDNAMRGNRIIRNEVSYISEVLCDAGAVYTLSKQPDSVLCENYIHDVYWKDWMDYGTCGVYFDEQTSGYSIDRNVLERCPSGLNFHATGPNQVGDNYIYLDGEAPKDNAVAQYVKQKAGVREPGELDKYLKEIEDLKPSVQQNPAEGKMLQTVFEDDFESYGTGQLSSEKWVPNSASRQKVQVKQADGSKVLAITAGSPDTKVAADVSAGNCIITYDAYFKDRFENYEGIYSEFWKEATEDQHCRVDICPAFGDAIRMEIAGSGTSGIQKEIRQGQWYRCKTLVYDGKMYFKIWQRDVAEPADWDIAAAVYMNLNSSLILNCHSNTGDKELYVDNVSVAQVLEPANKEELGKAIDAARDSKTYREQDYTADSWANRKKALTKAENVYAKEDAAQEEVDAAARELNEALANLVKKPASPGNVQASWSGSKNVKVTWKKVPGADRYEIYRSYKKTSGYQKAASTTKTAYTDKKAAPGKTVYYKVAAYKGKVKGAYSKQISVYVLKAPAKLNVKASGQKVTVTFAKAAKASGYEIYSSKKKNGAYRKAAELKSAKTVKKVIKNVKKGVYYYKIRAYQKGKNGKKICTEFSKPIKVKVGAKRK